jgi:ubiquinone/menaquinone biosynthesis C-methylase UbiE
MKPRKAYKGMPMEGLIAKWYAKITDKEERHRQEAGRLAGGMPPGSHMLEIAPGPGYFAIELARLGNYQITGLDISKSFVEIAQQNACQAGVQVDFRHGNAADMPFEDGLFDFTFCQAAFKNFTEPVKAISEMYRVLRQQGTSVIVDLRRDATQTEIERHIEGLGLGRFNRLMTKWTFRSFLLKNAYSITEMEAMVSQTRFQNCRVEANEIGFTLWLQK